MNLSPKAFKWKFFEPVPKSYQRAKSSKAEQIASSKRTA